MNVKEIKLNNITGIIANPVSNTRFKCPNDMDKAKKINYNVILKSILIIFINILNSF